jgi:hypothetical protein
MDCNAYLVNIHLPNKVKVTNVLVAEGVPASCDMLVGMDIIGRGDFAVSKHPIPVIPAKAGIQPFL